jgi:Ca2+-binding RTX toxin-like protein
VVRARIRTRPGAASAAVAAALAVVLALAGQTVATAPTRLSCTYVEAGPPGPAGNVLRIDDQSNDVTHVYREGDEIVVFNNADRDPTTCAGGTPTVFDIDRIEYSTTNGTPYFNYIGAGALAPGATPEASGSEIEVSLREAYTPGILNVGGSAAGESIVAGRIGAHEVGINMNAQADGANQDADYVLEATDPAQVYVRITGKAGNDHIADIGGPGFTGPLTTDHVNLAGGGGNDTLIGGPHSGRLRGDEGDDVFLAGAGDDRLTIGAGHDLVKAGEGDDRIENIGDVGGAPIDTGTDRIFAGPGNDDVESVQIPQQLGGDFVNCGPGRHDSAGIDPGDRTRACEQVEVRHLAPE